MLRDRAPVFTIKRQLMLHLISLISLIFLDIQPNKPMLPNQHFFDQKGKNANKDTKFHLMMIQIPLFSTLFPFFHLYANFVLSTNKNHMRVETLAG